MPCIPVLRFSDLPNDTRPEAGEIKSGVLDIVTSSKTPQASASTRQKVYVRVYRTSSEHFAVLFPLKSLASASKPVACINLKSCSVDRVPGSECEFRLSPRFCDGVALTLAVPDADEECAQSWLASLKDFEKAERKRTLSDSRKILPVVVEEEE